MYLFDKYIICYTAAIVNYENLLGKYMKLNMQKNEI